MIYMVFGDEAKLDYIVQYLSFEIKDVIDEGGQSYCYGEDNGRAELRSDLPDRILGMYRRAVGKNCAHALPAKIHDLCNTVLRAWIPVFQDAPSNALKAREDQPCGKQECVTIAMGALLTGLHEAGLYPAPPYPESMHRSLFLAAQIAEGVLKYHLSRDVTTSLRGFI